MAGGITQSKKICPLLVTALLVAGSDLSLARGDCKGTECAWWRELPTNTNPENGYCAVKATGQGG